MNETIKKQILAIRDTGLTNMFDTNMVQRLAYERDFYELVVFIEEHRKEYVHFILYGEAYQTASSRSSDTSGKTTSWSSYRRKPRLSAGCMLST